MLVILHRILPNHRRHLRVKCCAAITRCADQRGNRAGGGANFLFYAFGQQIGVEFARYRVAGGLAVVVLPAQILGGCFGGHGCAAAAERVAAVDIGQGCA